MKVKHISGIILKPLEKIHCHTLMFPVRLAHFYSMSCMFVVNLGKHLGESVISSFPRFNRSVQQLATALAALRNCSSSTYSRESVGPLANKV